MFRQTVFAFLAATPLCAQSLSVADLQAKIDAELKKGSEYADLLNDPDPVRAQMAIKLMLESGDEELIKTALDYGIYSPDASVRNAAIKAFFDGIPRLEVQIEGEKANEEALRYVLSGNYSMVPNPDNYGVINMDIGGYDATANCYWSHQYNRILGKRDGCFLRVIGDIVQVRSTDRNWYEMTFLDEGSLRANTTHQYINTKAETIVTIPIR